MAKTNGASRSNYRTQLASISHEAKGSFQWGRWIHWAILALVGSCMAVYGSWVTQSNQASLARTATVVSQVQTNIHAMSNAAVRASRGEPTAIDDLRNSRSQARVLLALLESGGYAAETDRAPVMSLRGRPDAPLSQIKAGLDDLDERVRVLEDSAGALRDAANAERQMAESLERIPRVLDTMSRVSTFTAGRWGAALNPHRATLARPEMASLPMIFSPVLGNEQAQNQWVQALTQTASGLGSMATLSERDSDLSSATRSQLSDLHQSTDRLARSANILLQSQGARLAAIQAQTPIAESTARVLEPLSVLADTVVILQQQTNVMLYLTWLGGLMALIGLGGLIFKNANISQEHWVATQESRLGLGVADSLDRLIKSFKRIVMSDGSIVLDKRLPEDPDSPAQPLSLMINRLLDSQQNFTVQHQEKIHLLQVLLTQTNTPYTTLSGGIDRSEEQMRRVQQNLLQLAEILAGAGQTENQMLSLLTNIQQIVSSAEMLMEEGVFKMDELRENNQKLSKKLKRLAESAQKITFGTAAVSQYARHIKVLATNVAIEASRQGEEGRKVGMLSQQIEQFSKNTTQASKDIDEVIATIQSDVGDAVADMEENTSILVLTASNASKVGQYNRDMGLMMEDLLSMNQKQVMDIERQAVSAVQNSRYAEDLVQIMSTMKEGLAGMQMSLEKMRAAQKDMRQRMEQEIGQI